MAFTRAVLFAFTALIFVTSCSKAPITQRDRFIIVSPAQEINMGKDASAKIIKENKNKLDQNSTMDQQVRTTGKQIAAVADQYVKNAGLPAFEWEFHTINKPDTINAFCLPGGKVFVYTGIGKAAKNEAQLATVMAHEIAHAIARHGAERFSSAILVQAGAFLTIKAASDNEVSPAKMRAINIAYGIGSGLGMLSHSRTQENEADTIGLMIMAKAGYDPRAALDFWENMQKQNQTRKLEFLSTHPLPKS
ncbi:MAG: M48 family metallopeptidase, partial [Campylobacterota bacterium]